MIPVCKPFWDVEEEEATLRVMRSGRLIQGPEVERFESMVAEFVGVRHAVACSSGTTALHLALMAAGVGRGDEVLVPAFTFVATANAVMHCGAKPVLCEINLEDFNMRGILFNGPTKFYHLPVHAFGKAWYTMINNDRTIEDAACALGAFHLHGLAATLSFHATKIITTGEGGMVVANDGNIAQRCRWLRDQKHGHSLAYNYRMTEMQGAIGQAQMGKIHDILAQRCGIAAIYDAEFRGRIKARIPPTGGNYQSYALLLDEGLKRVEVIGWLAARGVEALPGTQFLGDMPHLRPFAHASQLDLPNARIAGERAMRIPIWPGMSDGEIESVVKAVKEVLT